MIVTYDEIKNEVYRALQLDYSNAASIDTADATSIALRINQANDGIWYDRPWEFRKRTLAFTLRKPYATGTVSFTENSKTVTGSGTTWETTMRLGYIVKGNRYYKISRVNSTTELILEAPYDESTESGAAYKIVFTDYILPHTVSAIIDVKVREKSLEVMNKDQIVSSRACTGEPTVCAVQGITDEDYYNTGTVTVTLNSATVTGSGTTFTSDMEGRSFRANEFSKPYIVKSVDSTTQLTLKQVYEGATGAGKAYAIDPKGSLVLTFRNAPDNYFYTEVDFLLASEKLVSGSGYSLLPNHAPLLHGSVWIAAIDFINKNPVRIQQARADYERTLKQLRHSFKAISSVRWTSNEELRAKSAVNNDYNPLSSNRRWA